MHKNEGTLCLWQVTGARRHLAIDKRQRSQSLVPLRAIVSASVPDRDIRKAPSCFYYSLAASMIASANDGCGWIIFATSSSIMPLPMATASSPIRSEALPQSR